MAQRRRRPAKTPEARENQLIASAMDLASRQLEEGSASSQVITHFLKLGSTRERLEQERLQNENLLLAAKRENIESGKKMEVLYEEAMSAFSSYRGEDDPQVDDGYDDGYY